MHRPTTIGRYQIFIHQVTYTVQRQNWLHHIFGERWFPVYYEAHCQSGETFRLNVEEKTVLDQELHKWELKVHLYHTLPWVKDKR